MKGGRVLIARQDSMGDVLLAGPAVRAVAASADTVIFLTGPRGTAAARMLPGVDTVIEWDAPWIADPPPALTWAHAGRLLGLLEQERPDQAVILTSFHQSPLPLAVFLRMQAISPIAAASVDYPGSLLDIRLRPGNGLDEDLPEPLRALAIAEAAGFSLPPHDDGRLAVRALPGPQPLLPDGPYVVVHPGADAPSRTWPAAAHRATVELLSSEGFSVVVTGAAAEAKLTKLVAGSTGVDLGGLLDLPALASVLAGSQAVIVGNTGPAHLAAAVGTPVVSLFSPVVPNVKWAPFGVPVELLGDQQAPCRNSRARCCPVPGHPCLTGVTPGDVLGALKRLIPLPRKVAP